MSDWIDVKRGNEVSRYYHECYLEMVNKTDKKRYAKIRELAQKVAGLQAQLDSVMLEYCPEDMTSEQIKNWGDHQVPISDEELDQYYGTRVMGATFPPDHTTLVDSVKYFMAEVQQDWDKGRVSIDTQIALQQVAFELKRLGYK